MTPSSSSSLLGYFQVSQGNGTPCASDALTHSWLSGSEIRLVWFWILSEERDIFLFQFQARCIETENGMNKCIHSFIAKSTQKYYSWIWLFPSNKQQCDLLTKMNLLTIFRPVYVLDLRFQKNCVKNHLIRI